MALNTPQLPGISTVKLPLDPTRYPLVAPESHVSTKHGWTIGTDILPHFRTSIATPASRAWVYRVNHKPFNMIAWRQHDVTQNVSSCDIHNVSIYVLDCNYLYPKNIFSLLQTFSFGKLTPCTEVIWCVRPKGNAHCKKTGSAATL